jgi:hypothetical protein
VDDDTAQVRDSTLEIKSDSGIRPFDSDNIEKDVLHLINS